MEANFEIGLEKMMIMKLFPTIILGSIISAIILGVGATVIVIVENTTGTLGMRGRDFWWLALMLGIVVGAFGGGIEGFVISYFRFSVFSTLLFGIGFGALALCFYFFAPPPAWDSNLRRFSIVLGFWQAIYPVFVSLISETSHRE